MKEVLHIYKRVSSLSQVEGSSLKTQSEIGIKLAKQLNMDYEVHDEGGKSSANDDLKNRPVMLELLRLMDKGKVKHLFVYNTDRLSRNQITWYTIRQKMVANNVKLYTPKGIHDANDSMENMILGIMNEIAVYDNKTRAERSRLGKFEKVKLNFWRGGDPPFGYKIEKVEGGSKLTINLEESKWVEFIYAEYVKRTPMRIIKEALEVNKVQTRRGNKSWSLGSLQVIIRNEVYTGIDVYFDKKFKQVVTSETPEIISQKTFELAKEQRLKTLQRKGQLNRTSKFYLLRDFMICDSCETPFGGRIKPEKSEFFYYCPLAERKFNKSLKDERTCTMKRSLNIPSTDKEIWTVIQNTIIDTEAIKTKFSTSNLLGLGLPDKEVSKHKSNLEEEINLIASKQTKIEKALVKIETDNLLNVFESIEIYKGVKRDLIKQYQANKGAIETLKVELAQLGNHQLWMDWISQFGEDFKSTKNLTDSKKKRLINGVVKDIYVNFQQDEKLHHVRINFRLPVLQSVGEILRANYAVSKRRRNTLKSHQTIENTGAPNHPRSKLLHRSGMFSNDHSYEGRKFFLTLSVDYYSATLWHPPYSEYQQFLFDTISKMHAEGNSYIKIAQWMNEQGHLTPRGSIFKPNHAWSIHMKKRKSIDRFSRTYDPEITDIGIDII
jgi:DNA invertase Pin-like site-specific DNA recombinase